MRTELTAPKISDLGRVLLLLRARRLLRSSKGLLQLPGRRIAYSPDYPGAPSEPSLGASRRQSMRQLINSPGHYPRAARLRSRVVSQFFLSARPPERKALCRSVKETDCANPPGTGGSGPQKSPEFVLSLESADSEAAKWRYPGERLSGEDQSAGKTEIAVNFQKA